jgi:hypothetical protein
VGPWSGTAPLYGKLTYVGEQSKPTPSVIFHSGATPPEGLFLPFESPSVSYLNDSVVQPRVFGISQEEQVRVLRALASSSLAQAGTSASWALVLVQVEGEQRRRAEWLMDRAICKQIVRLIAGALSDGNSQGKQSLSRMPL